MFNQQKYADIMKLYPALNMSLLPTPIQKLANISHLYSSEVYCKRDDLTGIAFGGNKMRKLDFLIADAMKNNADTIIAIGANQSNFCRQAAAAAKINGLDVHLVLGGSKPEKPTGNLIIDDLLGAVIHHVDSDDWERWTEESACLLDELTKQGRKVYWMPIGGSTPIGALGYLSAFLEILNDFRKIETNLDVIILATSSAGTQAGLVAGKEMTGWPGKIIGMAVAQNKKKLENVVFELVCQIGSLFGINTNKESVIVDDNYLGEGYRARTTECENAVKLFAEKEGIILDYVYTGKAAAGLIDYLKLDVFKGKNILFIHTGGNIEIFE